MWPWIQWIKNQLALENYSVSDTADIITNYQPPLLIIATGPGIFYKSKPLYTLLQCVRQGIIFGHEWNQLRIGGLMILSVSVGARI